MARMDIVRTGLSLATASCLFIALEASTAIAQVKTSDHVTPGGIPFRHALMPRARTQTIQFGWHDGYSFSLKEGHAAGSWGAGMIMQGPAGSSRAEFEEDAKDAQARMSLQSNFRNTFGSIGAPPEKMDDAITLFGRALSSPALDPDRLKERIANRKAEIRQARVKAQTLASDIGAYLFLAPGPARQWRLGDDAILDAVTIERIEAWRKAVLTRQGLKVAVAGPEPTEKVAAQIDRLLGQLPVKGAEARSNSIPIQHSAKSVALAAPVPQTYLLIGGWSAFSRNEDPFTADMLTKILRERLFKAVREKLGAAYGASVRLSAVGADTLFFSASAAVEHEKAADALAAIRTELARFLADGITQAELDPQKEKLISDTRQSMRRAPYVARLLRNAMLENLPADHVETTEKQITAISLDHVNKAIREKLGGGSLATIIITPAVGVFNADCIVKAAAEAETCR
ncbi:MAG TPA: insulinase family protein [Rhabdaerophilum sp.]|nr:insulinase family protein [Rhabdaerophilum sp.]